MTLDPAGAADGTASLPTYPMSYEQESIWLTDQFDDSAHQYVESWVHRLRGDFSVPALEAALTGIVRRHESLRSRLRLAGGTPSQTVLPPMPVPLLRRRVTPDGLDTAVREAVAPPLPLDRPPMLRATLLEAGDRDAVLAVAVHHAVVDGWSLHLLDEEFSDLYRAALNGREPERPPIPLQFGPYAQRQRSAGTPRDDLPAYWRDTLRNAPPESTFPLDRPRPDVPAHRGGLVEFTLDTGLTRRMRRLCREQKATPFAVLAAALTALIGRHGDQRDVVLGTPVSRREGPELEPMIACLTDVMPLRQTVDPRQSFRDLVTQTKDTVRTVVAHKDVPYTRLVRESGEQRTRARLPLFQVVLTVDDGRPPGLSLPGVRSERRYPHNGTSKFDVFVHLIPEDGGFRGRLEYDAGLFTPGTAGKLAQRFTLLLRDVTEHPDQALAESALLTDDDHAVLREWGEGPPPATGAPLAHEAFARAARRTPDLPAMTHRGRHLTYARLDEASDALAARLVAKGYGRARIGILLERGLRLPVAVLAVLKAGGCCVPVDAAYPADRIAFMLSDSRVGAVLTSGALLHHLTPLPDVDPWPLDALPAADNPRSPLPSVGEEAPAYLIYTSGSTGRPKGVVMPHRALATVTDWQTRRSADTGALRTAQFAPLSFDVFFQELFSTWAAGGTLVLVDHEIRRDPARLLALIGAESIERLFLPYVALHQLAEYAAVEPRRCPSLKEVISAGEQLFITPAIRRFFTESTDAVLDNQYGPSETHVVTVERLSGHPSGWPDRPGIGRPVPGAGIRILDERMRPVPPGAAGEICIGGRSVATGYFGQPDHTRRAFAPDPDRPQPARLYRSGDRGRFRPDGTLVFLGRRDDQVKIRGYRVEPGEVESVLKSMPGIADAVVTVDASDPHDKRLITHYVPADRNGPDTGALRRRLRTRLPEPLVPSLWVPMAALPLTPSGKVDRAALPAPHRHRHRAAGGGRGMGVGEETAVGSGAGTDEKSAASRVTGTGEEPTVGRGAGTDEEPVASRMTGTDEEPTTGRMTGTDEEPTTPGDAPALSDAERRVAAVWSDVLGVDGITADDDFFALGGDSLLAVRLLLALRERWRVRLPLGAVFTAPTVARMAALLAETAKLPDAPDLLPDTVLDTAVTPARALTRTTRDPAHLLLTGATGFLGAFLLRRLLSTTDATVHCLVRASDVPSGTTRLKTALERYGLWDDTFTERIAAVPGDLARNQLGLSPAHFDALARQVDAVYHAGASVNLALPYEQLRRANVLGTAEVLRLAALHRAVPLHHVSTVGVYPGVAAEDDGPIRPETPLPAADALRNGYAQSKWAAETLVHQARSRGLPVSVYRPTRIGGATSSGLCQTSDYLWLLLKGCIEAGRAPGDLNTAFDLIPVDSVTDALVELSLLPQTTSRVFHLASGHHIPLATAVAWLRTFGYRISEVPTRSWRGAIEQDSTNSAFPLLTLLPADGSPDGARSGRDAVFDATSTWDVLRGRGVERPEVNSDYFLRTVRAFVRSGFLPPPPHGGREPAAAPSRAEQQGAVG
ncbi:amino acid adenylation domain-containing protein [Streptomyces albofaciens JCM 4342]|uniref:non-ribosomal peptide synthetase n=1 Tax=Streptomyces albofaciens TaxID=66866 RepID=UPI00123BA9E1|nr:non-ribosomal peptide synthetase [Streptomyces albofaciens]KAA6214846.1 amino acid adenylation domain-containing protein [Streptomyces albofaciens JCM 4342]